MLIATFARTWPMVRIRLPPICSIAAKYVLYPRPHFGDAVASPLLAFDEGMVTATFALDTPPITLKLELFFPLLTCQTVPEIYQFLAENRQYSLPMTQSIFRRLFQPARRLPINFYRNLVVKA